MKCSLGISNFLSHSIVFSISLHWSLRQAFSFLPFFGTLHSNGYIFPFLPSPSRSFFSQLFVSPPWTTILPFCISFFLFFFYTHTQLYIYIFYFTILYWFCISFSGVGLVVLHYLPEFAQIHVHWVSGAIQPAHSLLPSSPSVFSLSQHWGLLQWVDFSHQVAKAL